mgnify:CR=1 FL=1
MSIHFFQVSRKVVKILSCFNILSLFFSLKEVGIGDDRGREGMDYADAMVEGVRFGDQSQKSVTPCGELKDKGLCLFPLSMLLHYHG